ncbi:MAG: endo-1,4-beta-xylanase [Candidatus Helarchaeota archaeon]
MKKKSLTRSGKIGFVIFLVINASLIFLLVSPILPNFIGQYLDDQLLAGCDARIREYRTGLIEIQLQNATDGSPLQGWTVNYSHIKHEFVFGCNIYGFDSFSTPEDNNIYKARFKQLFEFAVLPFYWANYEPTEGTFPTEASVNTTLAWCLQNNITTKGHPLAWTRSLPTWWNSYNESKQRELLETRIQTLVSKYQGQIDWWDVVNEPIHTTPLAGMSAFDYCRNAYLWAKAANPSAHLTINDYGIVGHDVFGGGPFYNLINDLLAAGTPIDAIGVQLHEPRTDWVPATEIWDTFDAYACLGKPIYVTEFTPISSPTIPITNSWKKGTWTEENQAEYARRFYTLCFSHPACEGIIWWDLADTFSWLEGGGLLREDLTPKPVYTTLDQLINHDWRTFGTQLTNASGWIHFQGFFGDYNISVQSGAYNFIISASSGNKNQFIIKI